MAKLQGRPTPVGAQDFHAGLRALDRQPHPQSNVAQRTVQPINYSPLGPSTRHLARPLATQKLK